MIELRPEILFSCEDQDVVVTGGATCIGRVCAEALGAAGATVVMAGLTETQRDRVAAELGTHCDSMKGAVCDVTNDALLQGLIADVVAKFGRIDTVLAHGRVGLDGASELSAER